MTPRTNRSRHRVLKTVEERIFVRGLADTSIDAAIDEAAASPNQLFRHLR